MIVRSLIVLLILGLSAPAGELSVVDFGAVPDEGQDDTAAFQAAVNQGGTVRVPAGVYQVAVSGKLPAVKCPRSVRLLGEGPEQTIIRTEAKLTATGFVFGFEPGIRATVADLAIEGPAELGDFYSRLCWGRSGNLRIERCRLAGGTHGVIIEGVDTRTVVLDSSIACLTGMVVAGSGRLDVVRTEFSRYGVAASNKHHGVYVSPAVSALIDRCLFAGNAGDGFDVQSSPNEEQGSGSLAVRDCDFTGKGRGVLTHPRVLTVVRGCRLDGVSVEVQKGGAVLSESALGGRNQVKPWPYAPGSWALRDCRFTE